MVGKLPANQHPHNCQCQTCIHCANPDDAGLPPAPPLCDPCWGHGGAKAMTYRDYVEGHVSPPPSSSGSSSESNLASRFPTHNDFFGPSLDDVFVKIYNFGRNHPPPASECVKANCKCVICHGKCGGQEQEGCEDLTCPIKGGGTRGPYDDMDHYDYYGEGMKTENGGDGDAKKKKKKPKICKDDSCGKGKKDEEEEEEEKPPLGEDECDETTCGIVGLDWKEQADWGVRDAFGVGVDEALLALLSQFGSWFKRRKKKKKEPEPVCVCTEPPPYEPHDIGEAEPIRFEKGPLDIVHWLHEEYLSLCQDLEDAAKQSEPDTDGPLAPATLEKRRTNLEALSELLTEKRGLEQTGMPEQVEHKRSRAASHYFEADVASMGVTPKVVETMGPGGQRKSVINWEDVEEQRRLGRQSVSHQSLMGPRKSVVLRPFGAPADDHRQTGFMPPRHDFGLDDSHDPTPVWEQNQGGGWGGQEPERPLRSILHKGEEEPGARGGRRIQLKDDYGHRGSYRQNTSARSSRVSFDILHDEPPDRLRRQRSSLKYKQPPPGGRVGDDGDGDDEEEGTSRRRARSRGGRPRPKTASVVIREVPGDEDLCARGECSYRRGHIGKHQNPRRPSSIVEVTRTITETPRPERRRGLLARLGKSRPVAVDVEEKRMQTIWHSSTFSTDEEDEEGRCGGAEKPYVELAGGGGSPCSPSLCLGGGSAHRSRSFKEEDFRRARVRKSRRFGNPKYYCDKDWLLDPSAIQRTVITQFPSTQTVRVSATCNEDKTYYTPEGCKRTEKSRTFNTPRVVTLREGVPTQTGASAMTVTVRRPRSSSAEDGTCEPDRFVVRHEGSDTGGRHEFNVECPPIPPRPKRTVIIRRYVDEDEDEEEDDEEEEDEDDEDDEEEENRGKKKKGKKRKKKRRKKRRVDDDEEEDAEENGKKHKKMKKRKSKDDDEDKEKKKRREDNGKEDEDENGKPKKRNGKDNDEEENGDKNGSSKKRKGKKGKNGKKHRGDDDDDDEDEEEDLCVCKYVKKRKPSKCHRKNGKNGSRRKRKDDEFGSDEEDEDMVIRRVRAVRKNGQTKILPVITKVETLDGTKRRAVLEWDEGFVEDMGPMKRPCPKKCIKEVLWAVTKITVFEDGARAYEVKRPTRKTPRGRIPPVTEMLFMVQPRGGANCPGGGPKCPGGVVMYDKQHIDALAGARRKGAVGETQQGRCNTQGMTKAFEKTDVDRYRVYKHM